MAQNSGGEFSKGTETGDGGWQGPVDSVTGPSAGYMFDDTPSLPSVAPTPTPSPDYQNGFAAAMATMGARGVAPSYTAGVVNSGAGGNGNYAMQAPVGYGGFAPGMASQTAHPNAHGGLAAVQAADAAALGVQSGRTNNAFVDALSRFRPGGLISRAINTTQRQQQAPVASIARQQQAQPLAYAPTGRTQRNGLPDVATMTSYIQQRAAALGIDPGVATRVARSEGLAPGVWQSRIPTSNGTREASYGPFQLYTGGGLGNVFQRTTGLDPADPSTWQQQVDFALQHAAQNGWSAWNGAKNTGIGRWEGISRSSRSRSDKTASADRSGMTDGQKALALAKRGSQMA